MPKRKSSRKVKSSTSNAGSPSELKGAMAAEEDDIVDIHVEEEDEAGLDESDQEMNKLIEEKERLLARKKQQVHKDKLAKLKAEVRELRLEVEEKRKANRTEPDTISKIRSVPQVKSQVNAKLAAVNAHFVEDSDSEEDAGAPGSQGKSLSSLRQSLSKTSKKANNPYSSVDGPLFPNEVLGPQHALQKGKRAVDYHELNLRLLCLGESLICASGVLDAEEVQGRLSWLATILTYAKNYEFSAILTLHEEMITQVHYGDRTWFGDHSTLVTQIIVPHPLQSNDKLSKTKASTKNFTYFCGDFNSENGCKDQDRHYMVFRGNNVLAHHVCSSCLIKDKKHKNHPRHSTECPHKN